MFEQQMTLANLTRHANIESIQNLNWRESISGLAHTLKCSHLLLIFQNHLRTSVTIRKAESAVVDPHLKTF